MTRYQTTGHVNRLIELFQSKSNNEEINLKKSSKLLLINHNSNSSCIYTGLNQTNNDENNSNNNIFETKINRLNTKLIETTLKQQMSVVGSVNKDVGGINCSLPKDNGDVSQQSPIKQPIPITLLMSQSSEVPERSLSPPIPIPPPPLLLPPSTPLLPIVSNTVIYNETTPMNIIKCNSNTCIQPLNTTIVLEAGNNNNEKNINNRITIAENIHPINNVFNSQEFKEKLLKISNSILNDCKTDKLINEINNELLNVNANNDHDGQISPKTCNSIKFNDETNDDTTTMTILPLTTVEDVKIDGKQSGASSSSSSSSVSLKNQELLNVNVHQTESLSIQAVDSLSKSSISNNSLNNVKEHASNNNNDILGIVKLQSNTNSFQNSNNYDKYDSVNKNDDDKFFTSIPLNDTIDRELEMRNNKNDVNKIDINNLNEILSNMQSKSKNEIAIDNADNDINKLVGNNLNTIHSQIHDQNEQINENICKTLLKKIFCLNKTNNV